MLQTICIVISLAITVVGIALFVRAIGGMLAVIRTGQAVSRSDQPGRRTVTMLKETLAHTRMLQWKWVGVGHWFVFIGFGLLFFTLVTAFGQLFDSHWHIPWLGTFIPFEWVSEIVTTVMLVAIVAFIVYRRSRPQTRVRGVTGRFFGSVMWWGYFVEAVILGVGLCIALLRGLEYAQFAVAGDSAAGTTHFPISQLLGNAFDGLSAGTIANWIYVIAMIKIVISFTWMITISLNLNMGTAWHRFTAFFNIWFRREADGRTALGALKPLTSAGKTITLDDVDDLDENATLGIGSVEDFSWKGILDFTTCTECGRCQSQCPAWNTDKPLSPKLFITSLRDHAYRKAPYLQAAESEREALIAGNRTLALEAERPLVGKVEDGEWFYNPPSGAAVMDPDVLWSCTACGACVQQCPVDIEHVDHIVDMRRYQVLVESSFPSELNQLFRGLENKGNPWNMSATARVDWAKGLPFEVKEVGKDIESLDEVDWLFWVGCAGAYEDRAKKTTRAVAELLDLAGVSFGVLGNGETCTGDPARRAGNEFVYQGLAQQNVETFKEYKVKKAVTTCAHCFNTLKNEYKELGVELEVVHHTQLLNRLVREGKLTPVATGAGAHKRSITYHDPCYIGRHNGVYTPPRELLQVLPGAEYTEMPRNSERSFCCGAGGARMWMEENLGERINLNRTTEAVATGADQIAVGCPFCRVMLSDGLTAVQAKGEAREEVEVLDVAQMLLASVKGEMATKLAPGAGALPAGPTHAEPVEAPPQAEPVEAPEGTSLFDTPADSVTQAAPVDAPEAGTSLFDLGEPEPEAPAAPVDDTASAPTGAGSLFDIPTSEPTPAEPVEAPPTPEPTEHTDLDTGGSLFDISASEPESTHAEPSHAERVEPPTPPQQAEQTELGSGGSLFDIDAPAPSAPATEDTEPEPELEDAEPDEAPVAEEKPAKTAPRTDADIDEAGSLFDL